MRLHVLGHGILLRGAELQHGVAVGIPLGIGHFPEPTEVFVPIRHFRRDDDGRVGRTVSGADLLAADPVDHLKQFVLDIRHLGFVRFQEFLELLLLRGAPIVKLDMTRDQVVGGGLILHGLQFQWPSGE